ncbi:hypothetical protein GUITHDRAFT_111876 [Guillardia theta CCMP2712]|uniref:PNPLA domain-containing protein n=1 Tax=Guillardia theta (strain CCMP2712) TaxID=905079 RepID=L1J0I6_GUITC|nr:hypothetical protein GUITHDRAFT_111876 [Guillardia theta CCMP2712]EKX42021.1 hypothetical protein GUITHDRAFT_111876 [Guillardia theta CCMP2712]|eukprot:XP_005829001.1 hypothetical protein GUITHDRAFT_111876 [Guillardia theta CCMP2712]
MNTNPELRSQISSSSELSEAECTQSKLHCYHTLQTARQYEDWLQAAELLDGLEGSHAWKADAKSSYYDHTLIRERLRQLQLLEANEDFESIVSWLRSGLQRNFVGIGNQSLYEYSHLGTKLLIEKHQRELIRMMYSVANARDDLISVEARLAFFTESRHALGKTSLLLSGGLRYGMYHFGVVKALYEHGLLPRIISGSSFGAVVTALVGISNIDELETMFLDLGESAMSQSPDFPPGSLYGKMRLLVQEESRWDSDGLERFLIHLLGDVTFHEAYERTGRIVNVVVPPESNFEKSRLLNYLTSPNVLLWSAVAASCFPLSRPGKCLVVKDPDGSCARSWGNSDPTRSNSRGDREQAHALSLNSDLSINRLQELFNVNFFIVSQTNFHAIPFIQRSQKQVKIDCKGAKKGLISRISSTVGYLVQSEVLHRCEQAISLGIAPKLLKQTIEQKYVGDVTIAPPVSLETFKGYWWTPTDSAMAESMLQGERQTWTNLSQIRDQCEVELVLDNCVRHLALLVHNNAKLTGSAWETRANSEGGKRKPKTTWKDSDPLLKSCDAKMNLALYA